MPQEDHTHLAGVVRIAKNASLSMPREETASPTEPLSNRPTTSTSATPRLGHNMPYADFLEARRKWMASIIRRGFDSLKHP
jgi:hypothetical protein